jgi:trigger factor
MKKNLAIAIAALGLLAACKDTTPSRTAKLGDTVIINFAGFMEGVQCEGGTAAAYPLELGSGTFIPGFEDQLVGTKAGDTVDVNITFPADYFPALAGKPVLFKVDVLEIK